MTKKKDPKDCKRAGRPTAVTDSVLNKLEEAFSMGCSDVEACLFAGISRQTLYDYQAKFPKFVDRKNLLKETLILKSRSIIADCLENKDENTAKWYLERKKKDEFGTRTEVTGKDGETLQAPVINILPVVARGDDE